MSFDGDLYPEAGATSVLSTKGDIVRYNTERERYGIGSAGQVLQVASDLPTWSTINLADSVLTTQGDVLYEGASALARLGQSTNNYTLATKGAGANPAWQASSTSVLTTTGDILYASGANTLARLAIGSTNDVLTVAGGVPSWTAAAGGGKMELVDSDVLTGAGSTLSCSFTAINQSDIAYLRVVVNVKADSATSEAQDNIMRVNSISSNTYNQDGIAVEAGTSRTLNNVNQSYVMVCNSEHDGNRFGITDISCNSASDTLQMISSGGGVDGYFTAFATNTTSSQTSFDDIEVLAGAGNMSTGSSLYVYKVVN